MKKTVLLIVFSILLSSCGSLSLFPSKKKEKITDKSEIITDNKEKTEVKKDSVSKKVISKAIKDKFDLQVSKTSTDDQDFNDQVDRQVDKVLSNIDIRKESGNNSYHIFYDKKKRKIVADINIGETENSVTNTNSSEKQEKSNYTQIKNEVFKDVRKVATSIWTYLILILLFRKQLSRLVFFFVPSLRGIKTAKDLVTPPNKE